MRRSPSVVIHQRKLTRKRRERKAVLLLSGGLDSATAGALASREGYRLYALTFDYGQRHRAEIVAAKKMARHLRSVQHLILPLPLDRIGGSALTDRAIRVPKGRHLSRIGRGIPMTYVPARNTVFLSMATAWAEVIGAEAIFIGANSLDYSGYPDCRPAYLRAFERVARLGTRSGVERTRTLHIRTPLLKWSKAQIVRAARRFGVPYHLTLSCYDPGRSGKPCGRCDACLLREKGLREAGTIRPK